MKRRDFMMLLGGTATWPLTARAQQEKKVPVIGYFSSASFDSDKGRLAGFRRGLGEAGFVEGENVIIEFRWADGDYSRLPTQALELVGRPVNVILGGGLPSTLAAKSVTATIPIVFVTGADPVERGLVSSLNQPGGNITGVSQLAGGLGAKRLELLREIIPAESIAIISNPRNPNAETNLHELATAARAAGRKSEVFTASNDTEIDAAFARIVAWGADAVILADDPLFSARSEQLVGLAARYGLPAIYYRREFVALGGLVSYGSNQSDNYRLAGTYVGRVLRGTKPADLPVLLPTKFELAINLRTAKTLGLRIAPTLLARAEDVIE